TDQAAHEQAPAEAEEDVARAEGVHIAPNALRAPLPCVGEPVTGEAPRQSASDRSHRPEPGERAPERSRSLQARLERDAERPAAEPEPCAEHPCASPCRPGVGEDFFLISWL